MPENRLSAETSPYLLQHKDNPVHWWPWCPEAFTEARRTGRPILLSIGYAACHWCHVMAEESFEDPDTAGVMNALFVSIKVDREERPDVDALYQGALALTGEHGGWPLTMFLTEDAQPFVGGTYFPKEARHGRPAFRDVLKRVSELYRTRPQDVAASAGRLTEGLRRLNGQQAEGQPDAPGLSWPPVSGDAVLGLAKGFCAHLDPQHGGVAGAPKFPMPTVFAFLWRLGQDRGDPDLKRAVRQAVIGMCQGGIYDHVGGGFARYATDAAWRIPHFEKMLSDNGQLIDLLARVWRETRDPLVARRLRDTVAWLDREMTVETGAFAAALDADSEGQEGRFYVWTREEIDALVPDSLRDSFVAAYGIADDAAWEGRFILHRPITLPAAEEAALLDRLAPAREILRAHRDQRPRPHRDDKVLADWNGLAIAGLARAGAALGEPAWIDRARRAFSAICQTLTRADGRVAHVWCRGRRQDLSLLDDHAAMIAAALALYEATGDAEYVARAQGWAALALEHFADPSGSGVFQTAGDGETLPVRPRSMTDTAHPSGSGLLADGLARLWLVTGEDRWRHAAEGLVISYGADLVRQFPYTVSALTAVELLDRGLRLELSDPPGGPLSEAVADAPRGPDAVVRTADGGTGAAPSKSLATLCRGSVCGLPLTTPAAVIAALAGPEGGEYTGG